MQLHFPALVSSGEEDARMENRAREARVESFIVNGVRRERGFFFFVIVRVDEGCPVEVPDEALSNENPCGKY